MTAAELEGTRPGGGPATNSTTELEPGHTSSSSQRNLGQSATTAGLLASRDAWLAGKQRQRRIRLLSAHPLLAACPAHARVGSMHRVDSTQVGEKDVKGKCTHTAWR